MYEYVDWRCNLDKYMCENTCNFSKLGFLARLTNQCAKGHSWSYPGVGKHRHLSQRHFHGQVCLASHSPQHSATSPLNSQCMRPQNAEQDSDPLRPWREEAAPLQGSKNRQGFKAPESLTLGGIPYG